MKNKLISVLMALTVILSVIPVSASYDDIAGIQSEYDIKVLEGLGISDTAENYRPESYITRGDFFVMTARIMGYKPETPDEAVSYLVSSGVVSGYSNGEFKCDSAITYNEALKMLVVVLGYEQNAIMQSGWPTGYVTVASSLDLIEPGDEITGDGYVTRGMAAKLLVRAGNTKTAEVTYRDENTILGPTGGKMLFEEALGVSKISGIVNANSATALIDAAGVGLNEFRVGTEVIDAGNTNAKEYLGYYVDAYCVEDTGYKALAVVPVKKKNSVLRLSSGSDITATGFYPSKIEINYYTADGKQKRVKAEDCDVIYNGAAYLGFTLGDISINSGEVILLDNDADGIYEVIFINEYETYVVETVNSDTEKVFDIYDRILDLSTDSDQIKIVNSTGTLVDITSIYAGDVLSVQKSKNGEVITVQVVKKNVSGAITGMDTVNGQTRLTIGDK
ncbi:MAG: S-layer homology domain-containing protein, partial [Clostridia bacterium]|nr:S-layer homology domain-containing protein [Clostridia bacterium]